MKVKELRELLKGKDDQEFCLSSSCSVFVFIPRNTNGGTYLELERVKFWKRHDAILECVLIVKPDERKLP